MQGSLCAGMSSISWSAERYMCDNTNHNARAADYGRFKIGMLRSPHPLPHTSSAAQDPARRFHPTVPGSEIRCGHSHVTVTACMQTRPCKQTAANAALIAPHPTLQHVHCLTSPSWRPVAMSDSLVRWQHHAVYQVRQQVGGSQQTSNQANMDDLSAQMHVVTAQNRHICCGQRQ